MAHNGYGNQSNDILVLYKVMNTPSDKDDPMFNAFKMPRNGRAPNLASVKRHCAALYGLNSVGPEGYHWRVCVEDKAPSGSTERAFSWWDVQDENASLPVKEATQGELRKMFSHKKEHHVSSTTDAATTAAKGAFKSFGKAVTSAVSGSAESDGGPSIPVMAFKLLDLTKMHDDFSHKNMGRGGRIPQPVQQNSHSAPQQQRQPQQQQQQRYQQQQQQPRTATKATPQQRPAAQQPSRTAPQPQRQSSAPRQPAEEPSLMDFGASPAPAYNANRNYSQSSSFSATSKKPTPPPNESRAARLKREYAEKAQTSDRVWDDIDQRWVEKEKPQQRTASSSSGLGSSGGAGGGGTKNVGITLDPSNAIGKSANVQAAVNKRVNDMKQQQDKALQEMRERENKKKHADAEEDTVRKNLEPKIKAWSEDHGQKKQLRALLASLHTILWTGAKWKPISIGDVLDDSKLKKFYHKATLVVHPDKTHSLNAEQRFLAKRIFDALTQAKTEFDDGKR